MRERPILFNGDMVRAILEGRKTVTRRAISWRQTPFQEVVERDDGSPWPWREDLDRGGDCWYPCPFGVPGDRLWVRETFNRTNPGGAHGVYYYRADGCFPSAIGGRRFYGDEAWKPSIHMPRAASRILLEVTAVRVERLHDITLGEICKEGLARSIYEFAPVQRGFDAFADLWKSTGGDWDANPWVWVIEFNRVEAAHA